MLFHDRALIDGPARITRDGYLVADARVAQADNVQDYLPSEIGQPPKADGKPYRIGRPRAEVFDAAAKASIAHRPITVGHPSEDVKSDNWKRLAVGDVGDTIMEDGNFLRVPLKLMDSAAIDAIRSTHKEFSLGYSADIDMTPTTIGDQAVDGVMRNIRVNHLAIVPAARGGPELRIVDERPVLHNPEKPTMKIKIGDAEVDPTNGEAVSIAVGALTKKLGDAEASNATLTTQLTDANAKLATLETEKATLEKKLGDATLTPEKLRDAAAAYAQVVGKAVALGVKVGDTDSTETIMKAVVDAKMGDTAKGWDEKQIAASFAVLAKDAKVEGADPLRTAISGQPINVGDAATLADAAWEKASNDLNAWRTAK